MVDLTTADQAPRICLVEDSKTFVVRIRRWLEPLGYHIDNFPTAEEGLEALAEQAYDLLITDLTLSSTDMNGLQLVQAHAEQVKENTLNLHLPILVITGDLREETLVTLFDAGANDYLTKPLQLEELKVRVGNLIGIKGRFDRLQNQCNNAPNSGYICYVEDGRTVAHKVVSGLTEREGFVVDHFDTMDLAWQALQEKNYDVLLTNLHLGSEGSEGCRLIQQLRQHSDPLRAALPAIVMTGDDKEETLMQVLAAGANEYLVKPVKERELAVRLANMVAIQRRMTDLQQPSQLQTAEADAATPTATASDHAADREDGEDEFPLAELLTNAVIRFRWVMIALCLVLLAITGFGMSKLTFTDDYEIYFSEENPDLRAFKSLERTFSKNYNALFALRPKDGKVFTKDMLQAVVDFTELAWQIPHSSRVDSITNFQHTTAEEDDLLVAALVDDAASLSAEDLERIRTIALQEPLLVDRLISRRGDVTGVNVTLLLPGLKDDESTALALYCRQLAEDFELSHPGVKVYISGMVMMDHAFFEATMKDMQGLVPLMYLLVLVILGSILRSVSGTLVTFLVIVASTGSALGLAGWLGIAISAPSSGASTIILTLAVADSVHILTSIFHGMEQGKEKVEAIREALRINLQPVFLTSLTTGIGFLSMNFSESPPFHDLGNIVAMGVVGAFVYSVLLLPALMLVLPVRRPVKKIEEGTQAKGVVAIGAFVIKRRALLLLVMPILVVGCSLSIFMIELSDNFVEYFDQRFLFRKHTDFIEQRLTGIDSIEYALKSGEPNGVTKPEFLEKLDQLANWYRKQDGVTHVNTLSDILKRLNRNMHGDDDFYYRLPENRELAAQYLLLYEFSLPQGLDLNNQINLDKSATRLIVTLSDLSTRQMLELDQKALHWMAENLPEDMYDRGSSLSIMFAHIAKRNVISMLGGTALAMILISVILVFALRSIRHGLLSLIPNMVPAFMAFGLWGLLVGQIGLAISVVAAMTMGIIVDDTIHFLSKYLHAKRDLGMSAVEAVRYSFASVGQALWATSAALIAGFSMMGLSGFAANSHMGILTAITIALALITDFFLLPPLLIRMDGSKNKKNRLKW